MKEATEKQKIGRIGEDIAKKYIENKGFMVICQNYRKKCGEIDIIAQKGKILHFIEVKTVSELANSESADSCLGHKRTAGSMAWPQNLGRSETLKEFRQNTYNSHSRDLSSGPYHAPRETDRYRPEDNIHAYKLKRLARTIQVYLLEKYEKNEPEWVFDAITVKLDIHSRHARVRFLDNIVL